MANYSTLITSIQDNIKQNGQNLITGELLQQVLLSMIAELGAEFQFVGVAVPTDNPGTPDYNVAYIAGPGVYPNFGLTNVPGGYVGVFKYNGAWVYNTFRLVEIVNGLSGGADKALSAQQGVALNNSINAVDSAAISRDSALGGRIDAQDAEISQFEEAVQDQVDNYPMVTIEGNVTNAPDGEDLTTEDNKLKFANRSALFGKGYVILRRGKTFAEQVTLQNTIYEIRYDFDLGGASVTIPAGCVLRFVGGSLKNGAAVLNDTYIVGVVRFNNLRISGTSKTRDFFISWCESGPENYIGDVCNIPYARLVFDKDCSFSSVEQLVVGHIDIDGRGHNVVNMPRFIVSAADIRIVDIHISYIGTAAADYNFIYMVTSGAHSGIHNNLTIRRVSFDGGNVMRSFLIVPAQEAHNVSYIVDVADSEFANIWKYALYLRCETMGEVRGCEFSHIGFEKDVSDATLYPAVAVLLGDNDSYADESSVLGVCHDMIVCGNYIHDLCGSFSQTNDGRELHGIVCYGRNVTISNNRVIRLSASFLGLADPGMDAEAIYLKGSQSEISGNIIIDGCGSQSDGAITCKITTSHDNSIVGNTIIDNLYNGTAVLLGGVRSFLSRNAIQYNGYPVAVRSFYCAGGTEAIISENIISAPNGTHELIIRGKLKLCDNVLNDLKAFTIGTMDATIDVSGNEFHFTRAEVGDTLFALRTSSYSFVDNAITITGSAFRRFVLIGEAGRIEFKRNKVQFNGLQISDRFIAGTNSVANVSDNDFEFVNCTVNVTLLTNFVSGYCVRNSIYGTSGLAMPTGVIVDKGNAAARPVGVSAGFQYFDTSLGTNGMPIWADGSGVWIDAAGNVIQ